MTYLVYWSVAAVQEIGRVEQAAADPAAVRAAAAEVDVTLRRKPLEVGESRTPGHRVWYGDLIGVYYRVEEQTGRVEVLTAGPARRH
jgi:hypothetical protein